MDPPNKRRRLAPKLPDPVPPPPGLPPILPAQPPPEQAPPLPAPAAPGASLRDAPSPPHPDRLDFESFAKHLQNAAMHIYSQGQRPPYARVSALLLKWDDDVTADVSSLERVLRDRYNFDTERWNIPSDSNPSARLVVRIADFLNTASADHLLIIYYVGHGFVSQDNQLYWACNAREDSAKIKFETVRNLVDDALPDILVLLDSCASKDAPVAGRHGAKQVIAACTPEFHPREPGSRSFTHYLVDALQHLGTGRPFNAQRLYDEILLASQPHDEQQYHANSAANHAHPRNPTPVFFTLTPGKEPTIDLGPMPRNHHGLHAQNGSQIDRDSLAISPAAVAELVFDEPRVLVCTTFVGSTPPDIASLKQYIASSTSLSTKLSVEGMFLGPPTTLLISIPQSLWNIIEHDKICFSLGYINSRNLIHLYAGLMKTAPAALSPPPAKYASADVEDGRTLLAARQAAVESHENGRQNERVSSGYYRHPPTLPPLAQQPAPDLHPRARTSQSRRTPLPPYNDISPKRYQHSIERQDSGPMHHQQPHLTPHHQGQQQLVQYTSPMKLPRIVSRVGSPALKDEGEPPAEVKEAAEQLEALSNIRHVNSDVASPPASSMTSSHLSKIAQDVIKCRIDASGSEDSSHNDDANLPHSKKKPKKDKDIRFKVNKSQDGLPGSRPRNTSDKSSHPVSSSPQQGGLQSGLQGEVLCDFCRESFKDATSLRKHTAAIHTRPFPCAFAFAGCTSTFGSKNEWKRHIASQHLCLQYYRCSRCSQSTADGKGNEFNRKDLFTQHLRRMHAPIYMRKAVQNRDTKGESDWEDYVKEMQKSCCIVRRRPPQRAACPKQGCVRPFDGRNAWDDWTEHVGRHMENGEGESLGVDHLLVSWALDEGIIMRSDMGEYRLSNPMGNVSNNRGLIGSKRDSHKTASIPSMSAAVFPAGPEHSPNGHLGVTPTMPPTPPLTTGRLPSENLEASEHLPESAQAHFAREETQETAAENTDGTEERKPRADEAGMNGPPPGKQAEKRDSPNGKKRHYAESEQPSQVELVKQEARPDEDGSLRSITVSTIASTAVRAEKASGTSMEVDG